MQTLRTKSYSSKQARESLIARGSEDLRIAVSVVSGGPRFTRNRTGCRFILDHVEDWRREHCKSYLNISYIWEVDIS